MTMISELPRLSLAAQALARRETTPPRSTEPRQEPLLPISYVKGRAWFVALASPVAMRWTGEHFPAERAIEELGFECYVPRETRKVPYRGQRVVRIKPLLGSVLFVRFDRERDDWGKIRPLDKVGGPRAKIVATGHNGIIRRGDAVLISDSGLRGGIKGVYGIMRDEFGLPIRALDSEVVRLQRLGAAGAFDFTGGQSNLRPGDDVRVTEGAFMHLIGKIRVANHRKKLELIMGNLIVKIDPEFVEKV